LRDIESVSPYVPREVNPRYNPPAMTRRQMLVVLGVVLVVGGGFLSVGPPQLVLLNTSLVLQYPWIRGTGALVAMLGVLVGAGAIGSLGLRLLCGALAVAPLLVSLHLFRYRLEATDAGLVSRGVLGSTAIGWKEVQNVEKGTDLLLVSGPGDARIRVDTTDFEPEQRASLERTISRRVKETTGRVALPLPGAKIKP
jgi:PH (Pleckstrin Homology) domain-containing protein